MIELRTFDRFPPQVKCPVCGTSENGQSVLLAIDGTESDNICQAQPVHLVCAVAERFNREFGLLYRKLPGLPPAFAPAPGVKAKNRPGEG